MHQKHRLRSPLLFDLAEGEGIWAARRADDPRIIRSSLAFGTTIAVLLATGGGVAPRIDWGAATFFGLGAAVLLRGLLLAWHHLKAGGWRAWRERSRANEPVIDRLSIGVGAALALFLATGGGGIGPAFAVGEALIIGGIAGIAARALLTFARWP